MSCVVMRTNSRVCRGVQQLTNLISQRIRRDEWKHTKAVINHCCCCCSSVKLQIYIDRYIEPLHRSKFCIKNDKQSDVDQNGTLLLASESLSCYHLYGSYSSTGGNTDVERWYYRTTRDLQNRKTISRLWLAMFHLKSQELQLNY